MCNEMFSYRFRTWLLYVKEKPGQILVLVSILCDYENLKISRFRSLITHKAPYVVALGNLVVDFDARFQPHLSTAFKSLRSLKKIQRPSSTVS